MPVALGRTYGMSRTGWEMTAADLKEKLPSFFGSFRRSRSARMSQLDPAVAAEAERARQAMITMEEFVGTAGAFLILDVALLSACAYACAVHLASRSCARLLAGGCADARCRAW